MLGYKKGNTKGLCGNMPLHYPADRVYLDGDITKTVQDAYDEIKSQQTILIADKVYLIKVHKLRVLRIFDASQNELNGITIPISDRPSELVQGQGLCAENSKYVMVSAVNISTDGSITAYQLPNYNSNSGFEILASGRKSFCTIMWYVE